MTSVQTLRDFFAVNAANDELQEITHKCLSRDAQETLAGRPFPPEPEGEIISGTLRGRVTREQADAHAIAKADFYMAVSAALRFRFADAMMAARQRQAPLSAEE